MNRGLLAALCFAALLISGCSKNSGTTTTPEPGQVRIMNLIPTSPALSASINGTQLATVSYGQASPISSQAAKSSNDLLVSYTDPSVGSTVTVKEDTSFSIDSNQAYTVVATGSLQDATLTVIKNNKIGDIVSGNTEVQFFNGNTKEGALDVYLSSDATSNSINGTTPITLSVDGYSSLKTVPSGNYRILITKKGSSTVIYDSGEVTLTGQTRRLFAIDDYFGPGGDIRTMEVNSQASSTLINEQFPSALRVANMIPDVSSVDVLRNGNVMESGLKFGSVSAYSDFTPCDCDFKVTMPGNPSAVLYDNTRQTVAGESRTLVLTGSALKPQVEGRFILDDQRPISIGAKMSVINASPGAGNLDVYFLIPGESLSSAFNNSETTFSDFTLLTNGETLLQGRQYDVVFTKTGTDTIVLGPERVSLADSGIYSIFVKDAPGGGTPSSVTLADDFTK